MLLFNGRDGMKTTLSNPARKLYMVLSPQALSYATVALRSLFTSTAERLDLHLITDSTADTVTAYSYNLAGALTEVGTPHPVGASPTGVAIDPTGSFLYVANSGNGTVSTFTINSSTGALTAVGSAVSTGGGNSTSPTALLVEPSGQFLYVTNGDAATVSTFGITPVTGVLSVIGTPQQAVGGLGGSGGSSALAIE